MVLSPPRLAAPHPYHPSCYFYPSLCFLCNHFSAYNWCFLRSVSGIGWTLVSGLLIQKNCLGIREIPRTNPSACVHTGLWSRTSVRFWRGWGTSWSSWQRAGYLKLRFSVWGGGSHVITWSKFLARTVGILNHFGLEYVFSLQSQIWLFPICTLILKHRGENITSGYMTATKVLFCIWCLVVWAPVENLLCSWVVWPLPCGTNQVCYWNRN